MRSTRGRIRATDTGVTRFIQPDGNPVDAQGQNQDEAFRQPGLLGIDVEQFTPGKHLRTADLIHLAGGLRVFQAAGQILDDVGDGDGLALGIHPARVRT